MTKIIMFLFIGALGVIISSCATSSHTMGTNFPETNVSQIEKGKTTDKDLIDLFGQPLSKSVVSDTEVKWIYSYSVFSSKARSLVFTTQVRTSGFYKKLDVLLKDGVVVNFTYSEGDTPHAGLIQVN